ncbi:MAG TPA: hypothetical protein VFR03_03090 [Thermoanaerobaculia bacterium]|nr:hypothetical protein [Thermoanaerobaculia bacterium]
MEATTAPFPAAPRRRLRRAIALLAILLAGALLCPFLVYLLAKHRFEQVAGPLDDAGRFDPPSLPAGNAGAGLQKAARQLLLSPEERKLLTTTVKRGPAALRAQRQQLAPLLERNQEALQLASSLPPGPARLKIAYEAKNWAPPDLYLQLPLTYLLYARGALALDGGDAAGALAAVRSLGRQAEILEGEPGLILQLYGFTAEKYQLQLAAALLETGAADPGPFVLSNDLCRQYRDAITLQAAGLDRALWAGMDETARQARGKGFLAHLTANWLQWTGPFVGAAAFDRYRLYSQACDRDYGWIEKHLVSHPGDSTVTVSWTVQLGKTVGPDYPNVVARYRAAAGSRALIRACRQARATLQAGGTCDAIAKTLRGSRLEAGEGPSGCLLRVADGKDYLRLFVQAGATAFPQECAVKKP